MYQARQLVIVRPVCTAYGRAPDRIDALRTTLVVYTFNFVKPNIDLHSKTEEHDGPVERGYDAWQLAKVKRGLTQAQDRNAMIPVEQILADLKLDR